MEETADFYFENSTEIMEQPNHDARNHLNTLQKKRVPTDIDFFESASVDTLGIYMIFILFITFSAGTQES